MQRCWHSLLSRFVIAVLLATYYTHSCEPVAAQGDRTLPNRVYSLAMTSFYGGNYTDALQGFREAARGGLISVDGRWIDGICYHAMSGECYFQLGDLQRALEQYEAALKLFLARKNWMLRVDFPPGIEASSSAARSRIGWAKSARVSKLGHYPDKILAMVGRLDADEAVKGGGVVDPPSFRPIRAHEIARCIALSIRRRHDVLGKTCQFDPMTRNLIAVLSGRPGPPNHWSQAWLSVQLGLAYASAERTAEAAEVLSSGVTAAGGFDHHLTGMALLELGKIAFRAGKYEAAGSFFVEATLAAAQFDQFNDMEEAFRRATVTHLVTGGRGIFPPLSAATAWARSQGPPSLEASLQVMAAECQLSHGETNAASALLRQAVNNMERSELPESRLGGRYLYQLAHAAFQSGQEVEANRRLAEALSRERKTSARLYQVTVASKLDASGVITPRVADLLYEELLREPTVRDWQHSPRKTLGVATAPLDAPLERWFEIVLLQRKQPERACEIADLIRRRRFYQSLPLGGRLLSLRWILEAPERELSERAALQKQDLKIKFPTYAELSRAAAAVRMRLRSQPISPSDRKAIQQQEADLAQLVAISGRQEDMIGEIALRREPSDQTFPPPLDLKRVREGIAPDQLVLSYFSLPRAIVAFSISRDTFSFRVVERKPEVHEKLLALLKASGNSGRNQSVAASTLLNDDWHAPAEELAQRLLPPLSQDEWKKFHELIIVPDGFLWYVPFSALSVPHGESHVPLISKFRMRYLPTTSFATAGQEGLPRDLKQVAVVGKLYPRHSKEVARIAFDDMLLSLPKLAELPEKLIVPGRFYASMFDQLAVLDEVDESGGLGFSWSPLQLDRGQRGSLLADWMTLPLASPRQIMLPGFHTAAADGLQRHHGGREVFLDVCGILATGTRTALISRWRTGGKISIELTREFFASSSHVSASEAWQRSVQLARIAEIEKDAEPRINAPRSIDALRADHPFFWSSFMLVDLGDRPVVER